MIEPDARTTKMKRILVVANETVENRELHGLIREQTDGAQAEVRVVAPALNSRLAHWLSDEDEARRIAAERLSSCLTRLEREGIRATGHVEDGNPLLAIDDALHVFAADEIIIATHPEPRSNWLARDLVEKARRRYAVPVLHVIAQPPVREASGPSGKLAAMRIAALAISVLSSRP